MIFTLNGIGDSGPTTTHRMADWLGRAGHPVTKLRYPVVNWRQSRDRLKQYQYASMMLDVVEATKARTKDIVAHSHGCLLTARMMELGGTNTFRNVILFAPALDQVWIWPRNAFARMWVIHNARDRAVRIARLFPGNHPWGAMGAHGWQAATPPGEDHRVTNVRDDHRGTLWQRRHSHYFRDELSKWAAWVIKRLRP